MGLLVSVFTKFSIGYLTDGFDQCRRLSLFVLVKTTIDNISRQFLVTRVRPVRLLKLQAARQLGFVGLLQDALSFALDLAHHVLLARYLIIVIIRSIRCLVPIVYRLKDETIRVFLLLGGGSG